MKKILLFFIFSTTLFAINPKVYSALGDMIYNNTIIIQSLKNSKYYNQYEEEINEYVLDVNETRKLGFEVQSGKKSDEHLVYLQRLRKLSEYDNYFKRIIKADFKTAIQLEDSKLFILVVNSGLLNTSKNKEKIMNYYKAHKKFIKTKGIIQKYLDEIKAKTHVVKIYVKSKKEIEKEKEQRMEKIREKDKIKQEDFKNKVDKDYQEKHKAIIEEQEKELNR